MRDLRAHAAELRRLTRTDPDPRVRHRADALRRLAHGRSVEEAAPDSGCCPKRIRVWRRRFLAEGRSGLADRPRSGRPALQDRILELRGEHPSWGGRKLHHRLRHQGVADVPAPSTITAILRRHGVLSPEPPPRDFLRVEHPIPNALWQMDFMGHRPLTTGRVYPWTLLDDHSRFALGITACANEHQATVKTHLTAVFRRYGLPQAILTDNGSPWATAGMGGLTSLEAWLLRLGVTDGAISSAAAWSAKPSPSVPRSRPTCGTSSFVTARSRPST
jgi:transposase InsO family protein